MQVVPFVHENRFLRASSLDTESKEWCTTRFCPSFHLKIDTFEIDFSIDSLAADYGLDKVSDMSQNLESTELCQKSMDDFIKERFQALVYC